MRLKGRAGKEESRKVDGELKAGVPPEEARSLGRKNLEPVGGASTEH